MFEPCDPGDFAGNLLKITQKLKSENTILKFILGVTLVVLIGVLIFRDTNSNLIAKQESD